jgi:uncharacterized protein (TIGR04222 family)
MNGFELHGPLFLLVYAIFFALGLIGARKFYDQALAVTDDSDVPQLDPYEVAYLSGGDARLFLTIVASLSDRKIASIGIMTKTISVNKFPNSALNSIETKLLEIFQRYSSMHEAFAKAKDYFRPIRRRLESLQLLATDDQVLQGRTWAFLSILSLPLLFGSFQIVGGLSSHRPVGFLIALCLLSVITAFVAPFLIAKNRLTSKGKSLLDRLRTEYSALELNSRYCPSAMNPPDLVLAYGLFGAAAVGSAFTSARSALSRSASGSSCGGGGCGGSGCGGGSGGSSCGSGSSCGGGGGCGGGGCGGCGG